MEGDLRASLLASLAFAGALGGAGIANATVYDLNVDHCSGGCGFSDYGTITVTGEGTDTLNVSVSLDTPSIFFNQAGGAFDALAFNLSGNPDVTISGLTAGPPGFVANGPQSAGSHMEDGLGTYGYAIDYNGPPNNNSVLNFHTLNFTVTGTSPLNLEPNLVGGQDVFFSVDIASKISADIVKTGVVGATLTAVPEPATWALMLIGIGGLGAALRLSRRGATDMAAA